MAVTQVRFGHSFKLVAAAASSLRRVAPGKERAARALVRVRGRVLWRVGQPGCTLCKLFGAATSDTPEI